MFRKIIFAVFFGLPAMVAPAALHAACPAGQFYVDLKNCTTAAMAGVTFTPGGACAPAVPTAACPAIAGWKQAALKIVVPPGCSQANVDVEYEGLPSGWTVNLGDSPTNDGFAGDAGSTPHNAELWVLNEDLSLANAGNNPAVIDNPRVTAHLALTNSALKLVVKDQLVSWGNPYTLAQSPAVKDLYSFTDPLEPRTIYLGLNRVITGRPDRPGCGARRVLITFQ